VASHHRRLPSNVAGMWFRIGIRKHGFLDAVRRGGAEREDCR
jgi:hypothetical protein